MKVKELRKLLEKYDDELDIMVAEPDRCSIIQELEFPHLEVIKEEGCGFAWSERHNCEFPVGYKFLLFG